MLYGLHRPTPRLPFKMWQIQDRKKVMGRTARQSKKRQNDD